MLPVNSLQPVRNRAYVTYGLIVINALVFLWEVFQPTAQLQLAFMNYGAVICQVSQNIAAPETFLDIFRSMFFHASWTHLVGNMTFLWIFGRNVEDYFGHRKFLLLYIVWGLIAGIAEAVVNSGLCVPMIGASGAIAGVLGSYFLLYPGTRVRVLVIFFRFFPRFYDLPSLVVLGFWFALQIFNGVLSLGVNTTSGGVAFFAHIGGFVGGLVICFIYLMFNKPPERVTYVD